jgi:hypothetical protein
MFLDMEARALASLGDRAGCAAVLQRAERELDQRAPDADPQWIYYFDELELAGEAAHCARELGQARQARELAARALDPIATPPRTAAFISLVDAAAALRDGDLDEALVLASGAVELAGSLQSTRYLRYVSDFHAALVQGGHAPEPSVRQFTSLISTAYPDLSLEGTPAPRGTWPRSVRILAATSSATSPDSATFCASHEVIFSSCAARSTGYPSHEVTSYPYAPANPAYSSCVHQPAVWYSVAVMDRSHSG